MFRRSFAAIAAAPARPGRASPRPRRGVRGPAAPLAALLLALAPPPASADPLNTGLVPAPDPARLIYVDPQGGDDARSGRSAAEARRTPPERPAPGAHILFKGGSVIGHRLTVASGAPGAPVIYDGNGGAQGFGEGYARLDGTRPLGPWTPAGRTAEGLAIWRAEAPGAVPALQLAVFDGGRLARLASSADLKNNWVAAQFDLYHKAPRAALTEGRLTHPEGLGRYGRDGWATAALRVHEGANWLNAYPVTRFDAAAGAAAIPGASPLRGGKQVRYAVLNHADVFDRPGEFRVIPPAGLALDKAAGWEASGGEILYIPMDGGDPNAAGIRFALVETGVDAAEAEHAEIRGFEIAGHRRFAVDGGGPRRAGRLGPLIVRGNLIRDGGMIRMSKRRGAQALHNRIARTLAFRPIHFVGVDQGRIEGNSLAATPSGITLYRTVNSLVKNNDVRWITDVHGNALTVYDGSHNTWLVGNALAGRRGITLRDNDRVVVAFNRIRASRFALAQWAESAEGERLWIFNNDFVGPVMLRPRTAGKTEFRNNLAARLAMEKGDRARLSRRSHNLWDLGSRHARAVTPAELARGEGFAPFDEIFPDRAFDAPPSPAAAEALSRGLPYDVLGVEATRIGAHMANGAPPDLRGVGLPPPDADASAGRRPGQAARPKGASAKPKGKAGGGG